MDRNSNKSRSLLICLALTVVTAAVYCQVYNFEFLDYDDNVYVYENSNIRSGFTFKAVKWAFTIGYASNWHPLTWLSHILDWQLFGNNPAGHHITNLLFHVANTLLLFIILAQMTNALWPSAFAAALFALHPLHVESVAWVAERKDVLSTFFWLLTMWAYVRFVRQPKVWRYLLVAVFCALGLMSKPMLVTLPFVLLLLDYWPLERIGSKRSFVYLLIEKIPLFALAIASSIITFIIQEKGGAMPSLAVIPLKFRICNAFISYIKYICKMFWPAKLAVFYPHPGKDISFPFAIISAILLLVITIIMLRFAKKYRYLVTGWFWYLGTLVPVVGLVQVGDQAIADRYTYITLTGLFIIISWGAGELFTKWTSANLSRQAREHLVEPQGSKIILTLSVSLIILAMSICTSLQLRHWRNSISLFQHALDVTENNYAAHLHVAQFLYTQKRFEESIRHNAEALRIRPYHVEAINSSGTAFYNLGKFDEAIGCYKRVLEIDPCNVDAYSNYGMALAAKGNFDQAVSLYNKAIQIAPDSINTRLNLGVALTGSGKLEQAAGEYEKILSIQPRNAVAHNDFGVVLFRQGKFDRAITHFSQAVQINTQYHDAKNNLNVVLAEKQKSQNAENIKE